MLDLILLAVASRCADLAACPSDSELISALLVQDQTIRKVTVEAAMQKGELVLFHHPQSPYELESVICGERELREQSTVTCRFTARYTTHDAPQVVRLVQLSGTWRIVERAAR